ncbi:MAG: lipid A biosynthesis acyltransferase [Nitrospira sp.]|nr:lipid A biosynthesis acyltransferase [Nitrospira sp.]
MTRRAVWLFKFVLFIMLSIPLALLPLRLSIKVGELLGLLLFHVWGSRRRIAIENIEASLFKSQESNPPLPPFTKGGRGGINKSSIHYLPEDIARESFKNLGKSFVEIIKVYYGFGEKIIHSVEVDGIETFHQAQAKGKGILFLTGHCGNWELLAIVASVRFSEIAGVARPINNPYLNKLVEKVRQRYGNSVIYKQGALREIIERLRKGKCVGILMDQAVVPNEGYVIDFLGRGAWTTKMPALIARKTGAAALPVFIHRTDRGHRIKVYPSVQLSNIDDKESAVIEDTKRFSGFIEKYIQEHPSEWLWIHRRWKRVNL